jgi:protein-S-isoprenylcysteine O-methyltransferase Ste14
LTTHGSSRLPELGARGGGWVALQFLLLALIALSALIPVGWSEGWETPMHVVAGVLLALGVVLVVLGSVGLGAALTPFPRPREAGELTERGLYSLARHPIYGGAMLLAAGWSLLFATIVGGVITLALLFFFDLKARREESWLVERYPAYAAYRARTRRRFLPWLY